jgi:5-hydroxyisourate hydrolase-like protein (transthyretin family)
VTEEGLWYRDASHGQNIIGNELTDAAGNYLGPREGSPATDLLVHGNYFDATGQIEWDDDIDGRVIPQSLYLDARPRFYGTSPWPSSGADLGPACTNPARARHEAGTPFATPPAGSVAGTVTYTDGRPAAGVKVDLFTENRIAFVGTTNTGGDGRYQLDLPEAGCFVATVVASAGEVMAATGTEFHNRPFCAGADVDVVGIDSVVVAAGVMGAVEGQVTYSGGAPAAAVRLNLFSQDRVRFITLGFTESDGTYRFDAPGGGCYVMTFIADGGDTFVETAGSFHNRTFCLSPGQTVTGVDAALLAPAQAATIGGRITDGGSPVPGVRAVLYEANDDGGRGRWMLGVDSDGSGHWRATAPAGCYVVDLIAPSGRTWAGTGSTFLQLPFCVDAAASLLTLDGVLD